MHQSDQFYSALPKYKAELVDGQMYIAGSLRKSAMVLGYMVEQLGAEAVLALCGKELLQDALIEEYGSGENEQSAAIADFTPVDLWYYPPQKLASDLRLSLFRTKGVYVSGGTMAVKLGEEVFMPDVFMLANHKRHQLTDYYLDGAPDLIMEVVHPYMRTFDYGVRLTKYAQAGVAEVWMLDYERQAFEPYVLLEGTYVLQKVAGDWYESKSLPTFRVAYPRLYASTKEMGLQLLTIFEMNFPDTPYDKVPTQKGYGWGSVPFVPRLDLAPVAITFPEFIAWGGEVKFEMIGGKPVFGGSETTTKEWLGLLMMTLGLKETIKYLPKKVWSNVL